MIHLWLLLALARLWKSEIDKSANSDQQSNNKQTINSTKANTNLRWIRKLSTNMLLEIETDPENGQALSLKLLSGDEVKTNQIESSLFEEELIDDGPLNSTQLAREQNFSYSPLTNFNVTNNSDSGVSSNLQSPTVSFTDSNDFSSCSTTKAKSDLMKSQLNNLRTLQVPEASHRVLYKFCARHSDEIDLEIGDPIYVYEEFEDQWCDGLNIRTGSRGIFPSSVIIDVEYSEFSIESNNLQANFLQENDCKLPLINFRIKRERYLLNFMGSIEVNAPKGDKVLNEAIARVSFGTKQPDAIADIQFQCVLEISDIGLRMMDQPRKSNQQVKGNKSQRHDYFFSLIQITYCGYQLKANVYYFAFITRHPNDRERFACHVFQGSDNTRDVAEAVGRAFHRFYNRFVEITMPIDTFYFDN